MNFEQIQEQVKQILSEKRYIHSVGVMQRAMELAKIYGQDVQKAKLVGIAHDIAKEMKPEELYEYAQKHHIILDEIEKRNPNIVHSKVGADICKNQFGFTKDMTDAILYHTTGNVAMDDFAKIIFIADKTEKGRTYSDLEKAVEISNQNLEEGVLYVCQVMIQFSIRKRTLIHPDSIFLMNQILLKQGINK